MIFCNQGCTHGCVGPFAHGGAWASGLLCHAAHTHGLDGAADLDLPLFEMIMIIFWVLTIYLIKICCASDWPTLSLHAWSSSANCV